MGLNLGSTGGFNDEGNLSLITGYVIEYDLHTVYDVPDTASTAALLGGAFGMLGIISRGFRK